MKVRIRHLLLAAAIAAVSAYTASSDAHADVLTPYLLSGVFDDGGSLSGSFTLDSTDNELLDVSIKATAGSVLGASSFTKASLPFSFYGNVTEWWFSDQTATDFIGIVFRTYPSMTTKTFYDPNNYGFEESVVTDQSRQLTSAFIEPTPLPAALLLFAGGLGLIGLIARRSTRKVSVIAVA